MYMKVNIDGFQCIFWKMFLPLSANSLWMNQNLQILSFSLEFLPGTADFFLALTASSVKNVSKTAEKNY